MTNEPKPPLFSSVDELHEALVGYAVQALTATHTSLGQTQSGIEGEFRVHASERMAQIAQALWMDREGALQDARGERLVIDGKPLSSIEEAIYGATFPEWIRDLLGCDPVSGYPSGTDSAAAAAHIAARAVRWHRAVSGR